MREPTPGFAVPVYHSLTQPQLIAGVSQRFFILDLVAMMLVGLWAFVLPALWTMLPLGLALYCVVWCGTRYDTDFFEILVAHVRQQDVYEG